MYNNHIEISQGSFTSVDRCDRYTVCRSIRYNSIWFHVVLFQSSNDNNLLNIKMKIENQFRQEASNKQWTNGFENVISMAHHLILSYHWDQFYPMRKMCSLDRVFFSHSIYFRNSFAHRRVKKLEFGSHMAGDSSWLVRNETPTRIPFNDKNCYFSTKMSMICMMHQLLRLKWFHYLIIW